jgi:L-threonylcarbamoyladenylate synthase
MLILKVDPERPGEREMKIAGEILAIGGIAIYPTDTVYGIGCDVLNEKSVLRIYELKKREAKPLPILLSELRVAFEIARMSSIASDLAKIFWPGGLTIKVYPKIAFPRYFLDEEGKIAIRVPYHPVPRILAKYIGRMIVGTSANISGMSPPSTAEEALSYIKDVDVVIDAGPSKLGKPSTIVDASEEKVELVREGSIPFSKIVEELKIVRR